MKFVWVLIGIIAVVIFISFGWLCLSEADRQNRSKVKWFIIGMFFGIDAFIALKISKNAEEEGHSLRLWSVLGVFFGVFAVLAFEAGLNAENKLHDFDSWVIIGFVFGLFAVLVSCFVKPFEKNNKIKGMSVSQTITPSNTISSSNVWKCAKCGKQNPDSKLFCLNCGTIKNNK